jgi:hypothetical protein
MSDGLASAGFVVGAVFPGSSAVFSGAFGATAGGVFGPTGASGSGVGSPAQAARSVTRGASAERAEADRRRAEGFTP